MWSKFKKEGTETQKKHEKSLTEKRYEWKNEWMNNNQIMKNRCFVILLHASASLDMTYKEHTHIHIYIYTGLCVCKSSKEKNSLNSKYENLFFLMAYILCIEIKQRKRK